MKNALLITLLFSFLWSCDSKSEKKSGIKKETPSSNEFAFPPVDSSTIIENFERKIRRISTNYLNQVSSLKEYREMKQHLTVLEDSLKKMNHGKGLNPYDILNFGNLTYREQTKSEIIDSVHNESLNKRDLKMALPILITQSAVAGNFKEFLFYDSLYTTNFQQYDNPYFLEQANIYKSIIRKFDSLCHVNLSTDELLFRKGELFINDFSIGWNEHGVGYNRSIPFSYFDSLIQLYPESQFTDNAVFQKLIYGYVHEGEEIYGLDEIERYINFLKKYPSTELKEQVNGEIAYMYSLADISNQEEYLIAIKKGLVQVKLMQDSFPLYKPDEILRIKKELDRQLINYGVSTDDKY